MTTGEKTVYVTGMRFPGFLTRRSPVPHVLASVVISLYATRNVSEASDTGAISSMQTFYKSLLALTPESPAIPLAPSRLAHQDLSITFGSGRMTSIKLPPIGMTDVDSIIALWIEAPAGIRFSPRLPMEQERLKHLTGQSELSRSPTACLLIADARVSTSFVRGSDSILPNFSLRSSSSTLLSLKRLLTTVTRTEQYLLEETVRAAIQRSEARFFLLIWPHENNWEVYLYNPHEREEVSLRRLNRDGTVEPLAHYSIYADTTYFLLSGVKRPDVDPMHYDLQVKIEKREWAQVRGRVSVHSETSGLQLLRFRLDPRLKLDQFEIEGHQTALLHDGKSIVGDRLLIIEPPIRFADSFHLNYTASGEFRDERRDFEIGASWYPIFQYGERATFSVSVESPRSMTVVPSGIRVNAEPEKETPTNEKKSNETQRTKFVVTEPFPFISFGAGKFERYVNRQSADNNSASIAADSSVTLWYRPGPVQTQIDPSFVPDPQGAADDIAACWSFYRERLGDLPWTELQVHDLFSWHGRSYPGLMQLGWHSFLPSDPPSYNSQFRAHELAHQWFGVSVGFDSYHDTWLSEGIAEYLGLCYLQHRYGEPVFRGWLEEYRRGLLTIRDYAKKEGETPAALALGYRTASAERQNDYDLVVYRKGAWVVHMLRELLTNANDNDDSRFWAMLREFQERYWGRKATTRDLQFLAEKYSGADLEWFFRQWLYGNAIPYMTVRLHDLDDSASADRNEFLYELEIRQRDTDAEFRCWLPVRVEYVDGTSADFRLFVGAQPLRYQLPPSKVKPKRVKIDPNVTLLARF